MKRYILFTFLCFLHIFDKCLNHIPPQLNVAKSYINVSPNTKFLKLECKGDYDTDWKIPKDLESDLKEKNIEIKDGRFTDSRASELIIQHSYERTGLYVCYYKNSNLVLVGKNATSIYVFFNDNHLFKSQSKYKDEETVKASSSVHTYIPCLLTSSEVNVTLLEKDAVTNLSVVHENNTVQFNPMKGFLIHLPSQFSKPLICKGKVEWKEEYSINFQIKEEANYVQKPFIEKHPKFWSVGSEMNLSCTAIVNASDGWTLCWKYSNNTNLEEKNTIKELENGLKLLESQLYFSQVDSLHEGYYSCSYLFENNCGEEVKDQTYITVYDSVMLAPVKFSTNEDSVKIEKMIGESVEFVVDINYDVDKIEYHWEKKGIFIVQNDRTQNSKQLKMTINNLAVTDSGKYTVFVRRIESISVFSFELSVKGKPIIEIINSKTDSSDFYMFSKMYNLTCETKVSPEATVKWLWKKCNTWEDCTNEDGKIEIINLDSNIINKTEIKYEDVGATVVSSILHIKAEQSGKYFCNASNSLGSDEKSVLFIVADVENGIGVFPSEREPSEDTNDELSVTCDFTTFLYSNISWSHIAVPSYELVPITEDLYTERKDGKISNYSNSSVIKLPIKNVRTGLYVCSAKNEQFNNFTEKFAAVYLKAETETETETPKDVPKASTNSSTVIIISVVILFTAFLVVCIILIFWIRRKRKFSRYNSFIFKNGQVNLFNSELPLVDQVDLLPYDPRWEFPKDRLKLGRVLGHGAFGRVVKAEAIGLRKDVPYTTVAVKMLKERDDETQHKALMAELKILIHLGKHVNILNLLGAVTKNLHKGELMVMVEYCCHGNLRSYLLRHREKFISQIDPVTDKLNTDICVQVSNSPNPNQLKFKEYTKSLALGVHNPIYNYSSTGQLISCSGLNSQGEVTSDMTIVSNISGGENSNNTVVSESGYSSTGGSSQVYVGRDESRYSGIITTSDLLCYSFQCAQGMSYLSSKKLIHRDLAARNILLAEGNVIKIADFGLAKDLYKYSKYVKKSDGPLPIKWMAIESIKDRIFTTKSDVWSFGVLLWEIFTLGGNPYPGFEMNEQFFKRLKEGYRMEKPEYAPINVYEITMECWHQDPKERPEFNTLGEKLGNMLEEGIKQHYHNLNDPYVEENKNLQTLDNLIASQTDYMKMDRNSEKINTSEYISFSDAFNENECSKTKTQGNDYANASVMEKYHNATNSKTEDPSNKTENEESTTYAKIIPQKKSTEDEQPKVETAAAKQPEYLVLV